MARDPDIQERVRQEVRAIGSGPWGANYRSYLPFGAGHRSCIGEHFAVMEATIATIVRDFTLSTDLTDLPVTVPSSSTCQGPVPLHVERR